LKAEIHRRRRVRRHQRAVEDGGLRRSLLPPRLLGHAGLFGDAWLFDKARLGLRGRIGEDHIGLAVDGLEARRLVRRRLRHLLGQLENVVGLSRGLVVAGEHGVDTALVHRV
jgi:hypothetical protein